MEQNSTVEQKTYPIDKITNPLQRFMHQEKAGGIVLAICVVIAMFLANSAWSEQYFHFFEHKLGFIFDSKTYLNFSLHHWINDGLMAVFFFVVGLELKREIIAGELSDFRKALLPIVAALGGMIMPALIYFSLNPSGEQQSGWGIPMATDIAFALGVLYFLGDRIPLSLKIFLTALAIVDDLGAVLVIALFYTSEISFFNLGLGCGFLAIMYLGNRMGIRNVFFYAVIGIVGVWITFLLSGIHATIASVLAAFTIPTDVKVDENTYIQKIQNYINRFRSLDPNGKEDVLTNDQVHVLEKIKVGTNMALPPLQRLEHTMHPFVTFFVIPVFALANAGVALDMNVEELLASSVFYGVALGLIGGKVLGVTGFTYLFVKLKIAKFPEGMNLKNLIGIGFLASIGFTMSLFITSLAFKHEMLSIEAKIGIFAASIIGGVIGYLILKNSSSKMEES